jgi:alkyldihydroxyacetonephosphate synthase
MIGVLRRRGIDPVPVDILPAAAAADDDDDDGGGGGGGGAPRWGIDVDSVISAITSRTVAVLVVHPFGAVVATEPVMSRLRDVAASRGIELWEDCAQCYTGSAPAAVANGGRRPRNNRGIPRSDDDDRSSGSGSGSLGYAGSEHANVSFFSFGPIKTATALGGGLAILREIGDHDDNDDDDGGGGSVDGRRDVQDDRRAVVGASRRAARAGDTARAMRRIQDTTYPTQSNLSYLTRVLRCLVVRAISDSRVLTGLAHRVVTNVLGRDYDDFVSSLLRGFPPDASSYDAVRQLRRRPCAALLSTMRRRLLDSERTYADASRRRDGCRAFARELLSDGRTRARGVAPLRHVDDDVDGEGGGGGGVGMYGWVFPVTVPDPERASRMLLRMGYDAPRGGVTQLKPVDDIIVVKEEGGDGERKARCPRASDVFDRILYLPVTCESFSSVDRAALIDALAAVVSSSDDEDDGGGGDLVEERNYGIIRRRCQIRRMSGEEDGRMPHSQRRRMGMVTVFSVMVALIESYFSIFGPSRIIPVRIALRLAIAVIPLICTALVCTALSLLALSQYMGPIYLNSSNTFAKYCDMLFVSPFRRHRDATPSCGTGPLNNKDDGNRLFMQSKTVLELESTKIPSAIGVSVDDADNDGGDSNGEGTRQETMVLLTGATGFIGSLLLRELLLHRRSLAILGGVIVIVRPKRGKSARERLDRLLSQPMYDFLSAADMQSLVHVIEGDVTLPDCGMRKEDIDSLCQSNISHVFHCAAAVSFSQSLEDAAVSNITSSLQLHVLAKKLRRSRSDDVKFVYISTAFVHGGMTGSPSEPLPEEAFSLRQYDPVELYKSMLGSQSYASAAMNDLGHPNTYTFSKCICEQLLIRAKSGGVKTIIIRPSIVGPSVQEPAEGWAGEKPSTIVAAACLYLKFPYNMWCFGKHLVPFVPVDVVCRFVISKSFGRMPSGEIDDKSSTAMGAEDEKKEISPTDSREGSGCAHYSIATVAWDASSPSNASFSWLAYAFSITHLGAVCGHVNRVVAYAGLLLSTRLFPRFNFSMDMFQRLHTIFVRAPLDAVLDISDHLPLKTRFFRDLKVLSPIIDLPILFYPFANQSFYFKSDLVAPLDFNGERYMFSCAVAAHRFIQTIENQRRVRPINKLDSNLRQYSGGMPNTKKCRQSSSSIIVAGANHVKPVSDLWWALTQPKGNLTIRLGGWILAKIFRHTSLEIELDLDSFRVLSRELSRSSNSSTPHVIIAPTHRSFYDFLIVSYACFSLPELGLDLPHIAAASDFESIPIIGWLARRSHAFFLNRDGTKNDNGLKGNLAMIIEAGQSPAFIEVFIEGKRSRIRTFVKPKTGFLRCLARTEGNCIIFPITINYEGIPDQESLVKEANHGRTDKMSLAKLAHWMYRVLAGKVNIGRIYVSASEALVMHDSSGNSLNELANAIQMRQKCRVMVSNYHIRAASFALDLSEKVVLEAILELGCQIWPGLENQACLQPPGNPDLLWAAMLQFGHLLGPYLSTSHPLWSSWICPSFERLHTKFATGNALNKLLSKLIQVFDLAENEVDLVFKYLQAKGFDAPEENHVLQYLPIDSQIPMFFMQVVIKDKFAKASIPSHCILRHNVGNITPVFPLGDSPDAEAFGAWGYQDSCFVLNVKPDGSKTVIMKGSRYSISGKPLSRLANFVEEELNVVINPTGLTFPQRPDLRNIPESNLSSENVKQLVALLDDDGKRISLRPADRARRGTGHSQEDMYNLRTGLIGCRVPDAVVWPNSEGEVHALVLSAAQNSWCLIPFGGGTNVTHATHCPTKELDPRPMISVDMKLMCRVLWVNEEDGLVHVQAGITGVDLIRNIEKRGFTIGHEPDSYEFSTLGGWIATKASGMKQNRYGNIEDIVREVSVVGAKGFMSHNHQTEKASVGRSSIGVDLKSIMIGSEGCFGIIVSAVLKIWPIAESRSHESVLLPNFDVGMRFMKDVSKLRAMKPASVRLLDNEQFRLGQALKEEASNSLRSHVAQKIAYYMGNFSEKSVVCSTIAFEGTSMEVKLQKKFVRELASAHGGILAGSTVGKAGYALTFAIAYLRDFALNYNVLGESFETFVPWSKLTQVCTKTKHRIYFEHKRRALPGTPFVCCRITQLYDDGACVYFYFCMSISGVAEPSRAFSEIEKSARQEILINGGTLSHHHGLGKRTTLMGEIYTPGYVNALISMKEAIDPTNTFGARNGVFLMMHAQTKSWYIK